MSHRFGVHLLTALVAAGCGGSLEVDIRTEGPSGSSGGDGTGFVAGPIAEPFTITLSALVSRLGPTAPTSVLAGENRPSSESLDLREMTLTTTGDPACPIPGSASCAGKTCALSFAAVAGVCAARLEIETASGERVDTCWIHALFVDSTDRMAAEASVQAARARCAELD